MFLDVEKNGPGDEFPSCMSCKRFISTGQPREQVSLPFDAAHRTHELNGLYHLECARPYQSVIRAMEMLTRWSR